MVNFYAKSLLLLCARIGLCLFFNIFVWQKVALATCISSEFKRSSVKGAKFLVVHHEETEELVLPMDRQSPFRLQPIQASNPQKFGWVVPLPARPTKWEVVTPELFSEVAPWVNLIEPTGDLVWCGQSDELQNSYRYRKPKSKSKNGLAQTKPEDWTVKIFAPGDVAYLSALTRWIRTNHFSALDDNRLQYYVDRDWTFVVITSEMQPSGHADGHQWDSFESLANLKFTFPSERIVLPLRWATGGGAFYSTVYLVTTERLSHKNLRASLRKGFTRPTTKLRTCYDTGFDTTCPPNRYAVRLTKFKYSNAPPSLQKLLQSAAWPTDGNSLRITTLRGRISQGKNIQKRWSEDFSIPGVRRGEKLMGTIPESTKIEVEYLPAATPSTTVKPLDATEEQPFTATGCSIAGGVSSRGGGMVIFLMGLIGLQRVRQ